MIFLLHIWDRPWGFRIVGLVAANREDAIDMIRSRYSAQFEKRSQKPFAEKRGGV